MQPHRHSDNRVNNYTTNMQPIPTNDASSSSQWNQNDKDNWSRSLAFLNSSNSNQSSVFTSSPSLPPLPPVSSSSLLDSRYYPMSSSSTSLIPSSSSNSNHLYQPYPANRLKTSGSLYNYSSSQTVPYSGYSYPKTTSNRPRLTTILWEDESTICYQVDCRGICVARRQDNDMINGTKLLNVAGMSRGKRDGILKNERGRIVVKVGAMHLKGVWIPFVRAKSLATQFKIYDALYPIFSDNPTSFLYPSHFHQLNQFKANHRHLFSSSDSSSVVNNSNMLVSNTNVTDITKGDTQNLYYNQNTYHDYQTKQEKDQQSMLSMDNNNNDNTEYSTGSSTAVTATTPVLKRFSTGTKPEGNFLNTGYYSNNNTIIDTKTSEYPLLPSISSPTSNSRHDSSKPIW